MARPSAIARPEVVDNFLNALRGGNHVYIAADFAGINKDTLQTWVRRGAREIVRAHTEMDKMGWRKPRFLKKEAIYARFAKNVQQAVAASEVRLSTSVTREAETNWVAAMTMLERRFPERWSRIQRNEISGPNGGSVQIDTSTRREAMEEIEAEWADERETELEESRSGRPRLREGEHRTDSKISPVESPEFTEEELSETEEAHSGPVIESTSEGRDRQGDGQSGHFPSDPNLIG